MSAFGGEADNGHIYFISLHAPGAFTSTGGVRWVSVGPGEQLSALSDDGTAGTLVVVEFS